MSIKQILGLSVICALAMPTVVMAQAPEMLSLQQGIETALKNNRTIRKIYLQDQKAQINDKGAKNAYLPTLGVSGNYTLLDKAGTVDVNGDTITTSPKDNITAGATWTMPIDISGMIRNGVLIAKNNSLAARLSLQMEQNNLVLTVREAYYQILRSKASLAVAEEAVKNAKDRLRTAQALVDAGVSPRLDISRAEAAVAAAEQVRISAENGLEISKASLNSTLGRDINTVYDVQPVEDAVLPALGYDAAVAEALVARPEMALSDVNIELAKRGILFARRGSMPTLGVSGSWQLNLTPSAFANRDVQYSTTASMSFPVFDAYATRDAVKQAKLGVNEAEINKQDMEEAVKLEVRQVTLLIKESSEKVSAATKGAEQAGEALRVSRVRYEEGVADQIELSDAELMYTQAQLSLVNAKFDLLTAVSRFDRALGKNAKTE